MGVCVFRLSARESERDRGVQVTHTDSDDEPMTDDTKIDKDNPRGWLLLQSGLGCEM